MLVFSEHAALACEVFEVDIVLDDPVNLLVHHVKLAEILPRPRIIAGPLDGLQIGDKFAIQSRKQRPLGHRYSHFRIIRNMSTNLLI